MLKTAIMSLPALVLFGAFAAFAADGATGVIEAGAWGTAAEAFVIIVREGFEAILIILALVVYLRRSGGGNLTGVIWWGVSAAVAASIAVAWAVEAVFPPNGNSAVVMEGFTMLAAAVVLFYVSYWLFARREAERWTGYVKAQVQKAVSRDSIWALAAAAFLAVFREGAETVLFYRALFAGGPGLESAGWLGFFAGVLALAVIYLVMRASVMRLPIGLFFTVTAIYLYYLAVRFTGVGVHELQEAGWVMETAIVGVSNVKWLGLYPTVETLFAQLLTLVPLAVGGALVWRKRQDLTVS